MASVRAREKLSTEVTEMIVDAKQRLSDFNRVESWAISFVGGFGAELRKESVIGRAETRKTTGVSS